jgi:hypothetical protein
MPISENGRFFKIAQQDSLTIGFLELVHDFVQHRAELFPVCFGRGVIWFAHKLFLAVAAAVFRAHNFGGGKTRAGMEPAGESGAGHERGRFAGHVAENGLGDILGQVLVATHLPERGGIDQVDVPPNEFSESVL